MSDRPARATPASARSAEGTEQSLDAGRAPDHVGRWFVARYWLANLSVSLLFLAPALVTLALKVGDLVDSSQAPRSLSLVTGVGAIVAMVGNPVFGRLSDRTISRWGMRRPWIVAGLVGGTVGIVIVALAPTVGVVLVGWCLVQLMFNAVLAAVAAVLPDQVPSQQRGRIAGLLGACLPVASVLGTFIVQLFAGNLLAMFIAPCVVGAAFLVLFTVALDDRRRSTTPGPWSVRELAGTFYVSPRANPDFAWAFVSRFLFVMAYAFLVTYQVYFLIDELDAIGRQRGGGASLGGHDEREQTLNQILTEMDGFDGSEGVIVIAATNRPDILDKALMRPGRFDRRVAVQPPDQLGRRLILEVHTRKVPLADDVDLDAIASSTPGMVGADLKNLVNEAALMAARREHERVRLADFTDALEKVVLGAERRIMISRDEKERTAYHEAGHALIGMLVPGADPVRKVSIIPRGQALGVTLQSPESDRYGYDEAYLRGRITGTLGGRAAEEIVYGTVTTGAESDLEQVTRIARMMVGRWGYSPKVGQVSVLPGPQDESPLFPGTPGSPSERTRELVDEEVRRIIEECYAEALALLTADRHRLEALTGRLLEKETLDEAEIYEVAGIPRVRAARAVEDGAKADGGGVDGSADGSAAASVLSPPPEDAPR